MDLSFPDKFITRRLEICLNKIESTGILSTIRKKKKKRQQWNWGKIFIFGVSTDRLINEIAQNFRHIHSNKRAYYQSLHKKKQGLKSSQTENVKLLTIFETIDDCPQIEKYLQLSISNWAVAIFRYTME